MSRLTHGASVPVEDDDTSSEEEFEPTVVMSQPPLNLVRGRTPPVASAEPSATVLPEPTDQPASVEVQSLGGLLSACYHGAINDSSGRTPLPLSIPNNYRSEGSEASGAAKEHEAASSEYERDRGTAGTVPDSSSSQTAHPAATMEIAAQHSRGTTTDVATEGRADVTTATPADVVQSAASDPITRQQPSGLSPHPSSPPGSTSHPADTLRGHTEGQRIHISPPKDNSAAQWISRLSRVVERTETQHASSPPPDVALLLRSESTDAMWGNALSSPVGGTRAKRVHTVQKAGETPSKPHDTAAHPPSTQADSLPKHSGRHTTEKQSATRLDTADSGRNRSSFADFLRERNSASSTAGTRSNVRRQQQARGTHKLAHQRAYHTDQPVTRDTEVRDTADVRSDRPARRRRWGHVTSKVAEILRTPRSDGVESRAQKAGVPAKHKPRKTTVAFGRTVAKSETVGSPIHGRSTRTRNAYPHSVQTPSQQPPTTHSPASRRDRAYVMPADHVDQVRSMLTPLVPTPASVRIHNRRTRPHPSQPRMSSTGNDSPDPYDDLGVGPDGPTNAADTEQDGLSWKPPTSDSDEGEQGRVFGRAGRRDLHFYRSPAPPTPQEPSFVSRPPIRRNKTAAREDDVTSDRQHRAMKRKNARNRRRRVDPDKVMRSPLEGSNAASGGKVPPLSASTPDTTLTTANSTLSGPATTPISQNIHENEVKRAYSVPPRPLVRSRVATVSAQPDIQDSYSDTSDASPQSPEEALGTEHKAATASRRTAANEHDADSNDSPRLSSFANRLFRIVVTPSLENKPIRKPSTLQTGTSPDQQSGASPDQQPGDSPEELPDAKLPARLVHAPTPPLPGSGDTENLLVSRTTSRTDSAERELVHAPTTLPIKEKLQTPSRMTQVARRPQNAEGQILPLAPNTRAPAHTCEIGPVRPLEDHYVLHRGPTNTNRDVAFGRCWHEPPAPVTTPEQRSRARTRSFSDLRMTRAAILRELQARGGDIVQFIKSERDATHALFSARLTAQQRHRGYSSHHHSKLIMDGREEAGSDAGGRRPTRKRVRPRDAASQLRDRNNLPPTHSLGASYPQISPGLSGRRAPQSEKRTPSINQAAWSDDAVATPDSREMNVRRVRDYLRDRQSIDEGASRPSSTHSRPGSSKDDGRRDSIHSTRSALSPAGLFSSSDAARIEGLHGRRLSRSARQHEDIRHSSSEAEARGFDSPRRRRSSHSSGSWDFVDQFKQQSDLLSVDSAALPSGDTLMHAAAQRERYASDADDTDMGATSGAVSTDSLLTMRSRRPSSRSERRHHKVRSALQMTEGDSSHDTVAVRRSKSSTAAQAVKTVDNTPPAAPALLVTTGGSTVSTMTGTTTSTSSSTSSSDSDSDTGSSSSSSSDTDSTSSSGSDSSTSSSSSSSDSEGSTVRSNAQERVGSYDSPLPSRNPTNRPRRRSRVEASLTVSHLDDVVETAMTPKSAVRRLSSHELTTESGSQDGDLLATAKRKLTFTNRRSSNIRPSMAKRVSIGMMVRRKTLSMGSKNFEVVEVLRKDASAAAGDVTDSGGRLPRRAVTTGALSGSGSGGSARISHLETDAEGSLKGDASELMRGSGNAREAAHQPGEVQVPVLVSQLIPVQEGMSVQARGMLQAKTEVTSQIKAISARQDGEDSQSGTDAPNDSAAEDDAADLDYSDSDLVLSPPRLTSPANSEVQSLTIVGSDSPEPVSADVDDEVFQDPAAVIAHQADHSKPESADPEVFGFHTSPESKASPSAEVASGHEKEAGTESMMWSEAISSFLTLPNHEKSKSRRDRSRRGRHHHHHHHHDRRRPMEKGSLKDLRSPEARSHRKLQLSHLNVPNQSSSSSRPLQTAPASPAFVGINDKKLPSQVWRDLPGSAEVRVPEQRREGSPKKDSVATPQVSAQPTPDAAAGSPTSAPSQDIVVKVGDAHGTGGITVRLPPSQQSSQALAAWLGQITKIPAPVPSTPAAIHSALTVPASAPIASPSAPMAPTNLPVASPAVILQPSNMASAAFLRVPGASFPVTSPIASIPPAVAAVQVPTLQQPAAHPAGPVQTVASNPATTSEPAPALRTAADQNPLRPPTPPIELMSVLPKGLLVDTQIPVLSFAGFVAAEERGLDVAKLSGLHPKHHPPTTDAADTSHEHEDMVDPTDSSVHPPVLGLNDDERTFITEDLAGLDSYGDGLGLALEDNPMQVPAPVPRRPPLFLAPPVTAADMLGPEPADWRPPTTLPAGLGEPHSFNQDGDAGYTMMPLGLEGMPLQSSQYGDPSTWLRGASSVSGITQNPSAPAISTHASTRQGEASERLRSPYHTSHQRLVSSQRTAFQLHTLPTPAHNTTVVHNASVQTDEPKDVPGTTLLSMNTESTMAGGAPSERMEASRGRLAVQNQSAETFETAASAHHTSSLSEANVSVSQQQALASHPHEQSDSHGSETVGSPSSIVYDSVQFYRRLATLSSLKQLSAESIVQSRWASHSHSNGNSAESDTHVAPTAQESKSEDVSTALIATNEAPPPGPSARSLLNTRERSLSLSADDASEGLREVARQLLTAVHMIRGTQTHPVTHNSEVTTFLSQVAVPGHADLADPQTMRTVQQAVRCQLDEQRQAMPEEAYLALRDSLEERQKEGVPTQLEGVVSERKGEGLATPAMLAAPIQHSATPQEMYYASGHTASTPAKSHRDEQSTAPPTTALLYTPENFASKSTGMNNEVAEEKKEEITAPTHPSTNGATVDVARGSHSAQHSPLQQPASAIAPTTSYHRTVQGVRNQVVQQELEEACQSVNAIMISAMHSLSANVNLGSMI